MAVREFKFQGKSLEDLQKLDIKELAPMLKARARRKIARGFTEAEKIFLKKVQKGKNKIKTHCRDMIVLPAMVGKIISIHSGKEYKDIHIMSEMIGHRLGEFAQTRNKVNHGSAGIGATKSSKAQKK